MAGYEGTVIGEGVEDMTRVMEAVKRARRVAPGELIPLQALVDGMATALGIPPMALRLYLREVHRSLRSHPADQETVVAMAVLSGIAAGRRLGMLAEVVG